MASQVEHMAEKAKEGAQRASKVVRAHVSEDGVDQGEVEEGTITKQIESVTAQVPSSTFLTVAVGSIAVSALLQLAGRKADAQFVGQWVPTILIMGLYNKLVKLHGSEA